MGTEVSAEAGELRLTALGRELAELPLDPKVGRMLLAARDHQALKEVTIIVSALASQDPRDRPLEQAAAADVAHQRFADTIRRSPSRKNEFFKRIYA